MEMEMKKQMFGKHMFVGPCRDSGTEMDFNKQTLLCSSLLAHLTNYTIAVYGDGSPPETDPLITFFRLLEGRSKFHLESCEPASF